MAADRFTCTVRAGVGDDPAPAGQVAPGDGEHFGVTGAKAVLLEMMARGSKALPVGCRGGGCGVCRVEVVDGVYETLRMSKRHVTDDQRAAGYALACRLLARSDLVLRPAAQ